jgi:Homeodomain-like domain
VLLPDWMLLRRAYAAPVIWSALTSYTGGVGYRRIAVRMGVPQTTVRDWLRAFRRAERGLLDQFARRGHVHGPAITAAERLSPRQPAFNTSPPPAAGVRPSARPP